MHFNSTGKQIVTGSFDNTVSLWDPNTGRRLHTLIGHRAEISSAQFSYDGSIIATGSMDKTCKLWDARTGKCFATLRYVTVHTCVLLNSALPVDFNDEFSFCECFVFTSCAPV